MLRADSNSAQRVKAAVVPVRVFGCRNRKRHGNPCRSRFGRSSAPAGDPHYPKNVRLKSDRGYGGIDILIRDHGEFTGYVMLPHAYPARTAIEKTPDRVFGKVIY